MTSMTLNSIDRHNVHRFAQEAASWFQFFQCFKTPSSQLAMDDKLEIVGALYRLPTFRQYVQPFIKDDNRIYAFEDAVAEAIRITATVERTGT